MDIAAKLIGKYTLADVFKQLFHQARVAAAAAAVIRQPHPKGALRPSPHKPPPPFETCGYKMFPVGVSGQSKPATFWNRKQLLETARMRDQWSMSNSLKVSDSTELVEVLQTTIYSLQDRGCSRRRIARELEIARETVSRYLQLAKPAISTAGNGVGRKSQCEWLAEVIMAMVEVGLNAFTGFGGRERWLGAHQPTHTKRSSDKGNFQGREGSVSFFVCGPVFFYLIID
jgi:hypothetical protein